MIVQQTRSITARIVGVMARPFAGFGLVREIIGRYSRRTPVPKTSPTVDGTRADYAWYDRFRRGMEKDWELASPFAMPIVNTIVSWTLGDLFSVVHEDNDDLAADLNRFVSDNKDTILAWMSDALALGDGFMLVEPLGKLVRLSPDTVEIDVAADDVTRIERLVISTILDEENSIIDTWTPYTRSITRKINGTELEPELYENTLGIVPLVHLAWGRTANEIYGHPVYEQLLQVFSRYHDLLSSTLRGVELMGTPLPVAKGLENVKRAIEQNATGTATIRTGDGRAVTRTEVDWEQLRSQMLWLEGGADFDFKAPAPFASDSRSMLKLLFLIIIESVSIPEFVFGTAIASSKASADAQMPAFTRVVEYWRLQIEAPILLLLEIWLANEAQFTLPSPSDAARHAGHTDVSRRAGAQRHRAGERTAPLPHRVGAAQRRHRGPDRETQTGRHGGRPVAGGNPAPARPRRGPGQSR